VNLIKAFIALFIVKLVAMNGGAPALASMSNYQNLIGILALFLTLSTSTGVTVLSSKAKLDNTPLLTSLRLVLVLTPLIFVSAWFLSKSIVLENDWLTAIDYFFYASLVIVPFSVNILLVAYQVAIQKYRNILINYILVGIAPVTYFFYPDQIFSLETLLLAICVGNWAGVIFLLRQNDLQLSAIFTKKIDSGILKDLLHFGLMSGALGLMVSTIMIATRYYLSKDISLDAAGQWDGLLKIGVLFQFVVSAPILSTALPLMVKVVDSRTSEITSLLKRRVRPLLLLIAVSVFASDLFSNEIILLLYTSDFNLVGGLIGIIVLSEGFRSIGGLCFLVPIANKQLSVVILINCVFTGLILVGVVELSNNNAVTVENIAWLYLFSSAIFCLVAVTWLTVWLKKRPIMIR
jgi:polysaccharide transporter, PST family